MRKKYSLLCTLLGLHDKEKGYKGEIYKTVYQSIKVAFKNFQRRILVEGLVMGHREA